ncbi:MAG: NDP-hexose 4-ketoreductase, partial [Phycisphaerales bacterium]|nr:NDP-hexose 4-ketoreductase [Phycisphaerales bacterium]
MFERFTDRARKVMALANQEAQRFNHEYIGTEHILLGLVKEGSGVGANVLKNLDVDLRKVRLEVEKLVKSGPDMVTMGKLPQTPRAKKVIEYAIEEARNLNHNYVGTEHLLLGLLREHDGVAAQVLMNLGLKLEEVREEVLNLLGAGVESEEPQSQEKQGQKGKSKTPALDSFGRDLTELAKSGELDPVIGRKNEIE